MPTKRHSTGLKNSRTPVFLAILVAGLLYGCNSSRRIGDSPFEEGEAGSTITLRVENRNVSPANIRIFPEGRGVRLGRVNSGRRETFQFGWNPAHPLVVEIELVAGGRFRLPDAFISRTTNVELIVASELRSSILRF